MPLPLPPHPNAEHLRKQAKALRTGCLKADPSALARVAKHHPQIPPQLSPTDLRLQDAQLVLAREYGYPSWPRLMAAVSAARSVDHPLVDAINRDDRAALHRIIAEAPHWLHTMHLFADRRGREREELPLGAAYRLGNLDAMRILVAAGLDPQSMQPEFNGCMEAHWFDRLELLLAIGVDPNTETDWGCDVLYGLLQTYTRSKPAQLHRAINSLIAVGNRYEDGPVIDLHRGDLKRLQERLKADPTLVEWRFQLDHGNHLTLRGSTLLHVAAEYHEIEAIDLLLEHGADLDAPTAIGANGVGGQSPLFHATGANQGTGWETFLYLLDKGARLDARARIQLSPGHDDTTMDCMNKGRDYFYEDVLEVTPLGYALRYEHGPDWREASREVAELRRRGAPEA